MNIFIKFFIVVGWLSIIFGALYLPNYLPSYSNHKTLNIYCWPDIFNSSVIADFEKNTGIKVNISYYESNEELVIKLKATKGEGYDIIVPSDYTVDILRKENILKKLDKSKLSFYNKIHPKLLGHFFDPKNDYSIPYEWALFGIGIDKSLYKDNKIDNSWSLIFEPQKLNQKIIMTNDPLVGIPCAALYLFGTLKDIDQEKLNQIQNLLSKQRPYVTAYSDSRPDYYIASKNAPLALASTSYIWRSIRDYPFIDFILPKEGSMMTIENIVALKNSKNDDLIYEFLNYIYQPQIIAENYKELAFFPTTTDSIDLLKSENIKLPSILTSLDSLNNIEFLQMDYFKEPVDEQKIQDAWISMKS